MFAQADAARIDAVFPQFLDTLDCLYLMDSEFLIEKIRLGKYIVKSKIYTILVLTV